MGSTRVLPAPELSRKPSGLMSPTETSVGGLIMNQWLTAALWMGLALAASIVSIRLAISVALIEILFGVIGGNFLGLQVTPWVNFLAGFGSVLLTFLAGAEIEPDTLRRHWRPVLAIGFVSFLFPFLGAMMFARYALHWNWDSAK